MRTAESSREAAVWSTASSRMAASLMAEYLHACLRRPVVSGPPEEPRTAPVTVLLAAQEDANTVPRSLRALTSQSSRVILSYDGASRPEALLEAADRFGVWGVFNAREDVRGLVDLVRRALSPSTPRTTGARESILDGWHVPVRTEGSALTDREQEVVRLLCADNPLDTAEAARRLGVSLHTVHAHLRNVRRKLDGRYTGNRQALRDALVDAGWLEC